MGKSYDSKKELRQTISRTRKNWPEEEYIKRSKKIIKQLESLPEIQQASILHAFWPIAKNREVDVRR